MLGQILRELEKAVREGRLRPVVVGPIEIDIPARGGAPGSGQTPTPGGDIFGQILREILAGGSGQAPRGQPAALVGGAGAAVFGDRLESKSRPESARQSSKRIRLVLAALAISDASQRHCNFKQKRIGVWLHS
jgi:hypothetical protein